MWAHRCPKALNEIQVVRGLFPFNFPVMSVNHRHLGGRMASTSRCFFAVLYNLTATMEHTAAASPSVRKRS